MPIGEYIFHSFPAPGSGSILVYIMNILKHFNFGPGEDVSMYHRITEAFKWAYALRTRFGDPNDPEITEEVIGVAILFSTLIFKPYNI